MLLSISSNMESKSKARLFFGQVFTDNQSISVANLRIELTPRDTDDMDAPIRWTKTDDEGDFRIFDIMSGEYSFRLYDAQNTTIYEDVVVIPDGQDTTEYNVTLR